MTSRRLSRTAAARPGIMPGPQRPQPLALAGLWLADAVLQYQPFMVTKAFGASLAASATGNTGVVAGPVNWAATLIEHHPVVLNALSATIQLLLAAGLAWKPTLRLALGASIAWSLAVRWLGEGMGRMLNQTASPVSGAPGGAVFYALLAVLLWPSARDDAAAPFPAARSIGVRASQAT